MSDLITITLPTKVLWQLVQRVHLNTTNKLHLPTVVPWQYVPRIDDLLFDVPHPNWLAIATNVADWVVSDVTSGKPLGVAQADELPQPEGKLLDEFPDWCGTVPVGMIIQRLFRRRRVWPPPPQPWLLNRKFDAVELLTIGVRFAHAADKFQGLPVANDLQDASKRLIAMASAASKQLVESIEM